MSSSKKVEELSVAELRVMVDAATAAWRDFVSARTLPPRIIELRAELKPLEDERTLMVSQAWKTLRSFEKRLAKAEEKL